MRAPVSRVESGGGRLGNGPGEAHGPSTSKKIQVDSGDGTDRKMHLDAHTGLWLRRVSPSSRGAPCVESRAIEASSRSLSRCFSSPFDCSSLYLARWRICQPSSSLSLDS